MTALESLAVAALHRWSYGRDSLRQGTRQAKRNGYTPRQSRQADARHVADILGCSPQLAQFHAARALADLTDDLDRLHLL